jgi:hypothetical protein
MLHSPIDHDLVASHQWPDDPADDGNALAGVFYAVLIQVGVGLGVFVVWLAVTLLLSWLF